MSAPVKRLGLQDMMFLYGETPSTMMHVGALLPFGPPPTTKTDFRQLVEDARDREVVAPWNRKLSHPRLLYSPTQSWVIDDDFDLDYHVRRSALSSPGDERELGVLVSRLHSNPLDFTRPPWELHLIEGLEGDRFAMYIKIHHSLVDGFTGMKILARSFSADPRERDQRLFFNIGAPARPTKPAPSTRRGLPNVGNVVGAITGGSKSVFDVTRAMVNTQLRRDNKFRHLTGSAQAPYCILNRRVSRNRRFATQQYATSRLKKVGAPQQATINDVACAIIGGGLRTFLGELGELPDTSLVALLPVNVRAKGDEGGGNAIGAILVPLGTDIADPVQRLAAVTASTQMSKAQLQTMSRNAILAYSAGLVAPAGTQLARAITGFAPPWPVAFNLTVSNVPGPDDELYFNGSRLEASFPVSLTTHGMALNVTLHGYAGTLNFGFVGCRDTLPHLQRLAVYTSEALEAVEEASGV